MTSSKFVQDLRKSRAAFIYKARSVGWLDSTVGRVIVEDFLIQFDNAVVELNRYTEEDSEGVQENQPELPF